VSYQDETGARPHIVALGGGYGLSTSLRASRTFAGRITGIVSVADDGGSSGRLRRAFGIPAPGDLRRCLVALAETGSPWADAFEHRFAASELEGHPLGNIILAGLTETLGSFGAAIDQALTLLGGVGKVYPATVAPVVLKATYERKAGTEDQPISVIGTVEGEVRVGATTGLTSVAVVPSDPEVPQEALDAIADADLVCIGPGSLFTSVLAVTAVPRIRKALAATKGKRVYVANLAEQHPETTGFDVADHIRALEEHGVVIDTVLTDPRGLPRGTIRDVTVLSMPLGSDHDGRLHDERLLAAALLRLL
jgi:uncharacterized cofD-like protein